MVSPQRRATCPASGLSVAGNWRLGEPLSTQNAHIFLLYKSHDSILLGKISDTLEGKGDSPGGEGMKDEGQIGTMETQLQPEGTLEGGKGVFHSHPTPALRQGWFRGRAGHRSMGPGLGAALLLALLPLVPAGILLGAGAGVDVPPPPGPQVEATETTSPPKTVPLNPVVDPEKALASPGGTEPLASSDIPPAPQPGTVMSDRIANYTMAVSLDPTKQLLTGTQTITWTNRSLEPVSDVQLHLYWNAFLNERSSLMRERGKGRFRFDTEPYEQGDWGYVDLKSFVQAGQELVGGLEYLAPDDGNSDDRTVARIPLATAVGPGETVTFETRFEAKVPRVIARAGFFHDFYLVGQWFPKLGLLEYPGIGRATEVAWNCHQYHSHSEFYADFGAYDVSITVPADFKVAATGVRTETRTDPGGTVTYRYQQADVQDFAWTASPDFIEIDEKWEVQGMPPVNIHLVVPPEYLESAEPTLEAIKMALKRYGERWFPYPHPQITIVVPPFNADEAGGMEYPTFITTWGDVHPGYASGIRNVTVHEFGHQYWQGMLASNEFEESWLDEGVNSYGTALVMDESDMLIRPEISPILGFPFRLPVRGFPAYEVTRGILGADFSSPILTRSWEYLNGGDYGLNSYSRPFMTLTMLQRYLTPEVMDRCMQVYARRFAFKHPTSEDFFRTFEEVSGQELDWFFDQFFRQNLILDYRIDSIQVDELGDEEGYFEVDGKRVVIDGEQREKERKARKEAEEKRKADAGEKTATATPSTGSAAGTPGSEKSGETTAVDATKLSPDTSLYTSHVVVTREGTATFPVKVKVTFEDGTEVLENWDGQSDWKRFTYTRASKTKQAVVDPDFILWLDEDRLNNALSKEANVTPSLRVNALLLSIGQWLVATLTNLV